MNSFVCKLITGGYVLLTLACFFGGIIEYVLGMTQPKYCEATMYYNEGSNNYTPVEIKEIYDNCMGDASIKQRNGIILSVLGGFGLLLYCIISLLIRCRKEQQKANQKILNEIVTV